MSTCAWEHKHVATDKRLALYYKKKGGTHLSEKCRLAGRLGLGEDGKESCNPPRVAFLGPSIIRRHLPSVARVARREAGSCDLNLISLPKETVPAVSTKRLHLTFPCPQQMPVPWRCPSRQWFDLASPLTSGLLTPL